MKDERVSGLGSKSLCLSFFMRQKMASSLVLLCVILYAGKVSSIEIPPEVEKKAVSLQKAHAEAESLFAAQCAKCHKAPDPAKPAAARKDCSTGLTKDDFLRALNYMADVRAGKGLYETYCVRCHALIEPGSHTFDYWSKNICASDSCMVKRKLNGDEEQQLLLYLSSHAGKN